MIQCQVCNKNLKQITRNHLVQHKISVAEYKILFPSSPLQDESIIMRGESNPFYGKKHSDETVKVLKEKALTRTPNPEVGKKISNLWKDPNGNYRKLMSSEEYRQKMKFVMTDWWSSATESEKEKRFEKMKQTNLSNKRWLPVEDKDPFVVYRDEVRRITEETYIENFKSIENASLRGKGYDLDHVVSIYDGYLNEIPVEIMASIHNIRIIPTTANRSKSRKSHKTCEQLLEESNNA